MNRPLSEWPVLRAHWEVGLIDEKKNILFLKDVVRLHAIVDKETEYSLRLPIESSQMQN